MGRRRSDRRRIPASVTSPDGARISEVNEFRVPNSKFPMRLLWECGVWNLESPSVAAEPRQVSGSDPGACLLVRTSVPSSERWIGSCREGQTHVLVAGSSRLVRAGTDGGPIRLGVTPPRPGSPHHDFGVTPNRLAVHVRPPRRALWRRRIGRRADLFAQVLDRSLGRRRASAPGVPSRGDRQRLAGRTRARAAGHRAEYPRLFTLPPPAGRFAAAPQFERPVSADRVPVGRGPDQRAHGDVARCQAADRGQYPGTGCQRAAVPLPEQLLAGRRFPDGRCWPLDLHQPALPGDLRLHVRGGIGRRMDPVHPSGRPGAGAGTMAPGGSSRGRVRPGIPDDRPWGNRPLGP